VTTETQPAMLDFAGMLNGDLADRPGKDDLPARIQSCDLAFHMDEIGWKAADDRRKTIHDRQSRRIRTA
jgi:hypothetical protein